MAAANDKCDRKTFVGYLTRFILVSEKYNEEKKRFEEERDLFNSKAIEFFNETGTDSELFEAQEFLLGNLARCGYSVTKVQRTKINWNIKKLKTTFGKRILDSIITKKYEIINMKGLIEYLKECGVNPTRFKTFISVSESVDQQRLDELEKLGKISEDQLDGCYEVECGDPYFQIRKKRNAAK